MKIGAKGIRADRLIDKLFLAARMNPRAPINEPGRLTGRHCAMRLKRAQARRKQGRRKCSPKGKAWYAPCGPGLVGS